MSKRLITGVVSIVLFLTIVTGISFAENVHRTKILILHSYHQGLEWSDSETEGITASFAEHPEYELHFEYLDLKRNHGDEYIAQLTELFMEKATDIDYAAIIAVDNAALEFVQKYGAKLYGDVPIVFCGVNNYSPELIRNRDMVTGIAEKVDHRDNINLILSLHENAEKIVIINDQTLTGNAIMEELKPILDEYAGVVEFEILDHFNLDNMKEELLDYTMNTPIYLLVVNRDSEDRFVSYFDGISVVRKSTDVPIYGAWDFYLGKGIIGGKITSGKEHGYEAGQMLLRILAGESPSDIPVIEDHLNQYRFDYNEVVQHGLDMSRFPKKAIFINKPPTHFEKYKVFYINGLIILGTILAAYFVYGFSRKWENMKLENLIYRKKNAQEYSDDALYKLAMIDALTQIYNRRYILKKLEHEINIIQAIDQELAVIMFDIDHFKQINDQYGHVIGDQILKHIVNCVSHQLGHDACFGRYGGDEFIIILPETTLEEGCRIAEVIRSSVEQSKHHKLDLNMSISCGVISVDVAKPFITVLEEVDELLRESKTRGRNCVSF